MNMASGSGTSRSTDKPTEGSSSSKRPRKWNENRIGGGETRVVNRENPFLNELIMTNILKQFNSLDELKPLRQVCPLWNRLTANKWRPVGTIKLGATSENYCLRFEDFWRQFNDPNDPDEFAKKPFTKYILSGINLLDFPALQIFDNDPSNHNFWNSVGPIITYLQFDQCTFPVDHPELFEAIITEKLTNLKTLLLTDNHTMSSVSFLETHSLDYPPASLDKFRSDMKRSQSLNTIRISGLTPMNLCTMLLNSPNIQNIHIEGDVGRDPHYTFWMLRHTFLMKFILDHGLYELNHPDFWTRDVCRLLPRMTVPLKHLALTIPSSSPTTQLTELCHMYGDTLQVLKLFRAPHPWNRFCIYSFGKRGPMYSLTELYLYGNVVRNLVFLRYLRNLKVLYVDLKCYDKVDSILGHRYPPEVTNGRAAYRPNLGKSLINPKFRGEMCLGQMEKLHLNTQTFLFCSATDLTARVRKLQTWMPNLKVFETNLDVNGFRAVCRLMPRLEELVLLFESRVGDEGVTGIIPGQNENRHPWNITSFSNLKRFELKTLCGMPAWFDKNRIGDQSVVHGFLKMNTLQSVVISASRNMSKEAEECLKRHVAQVEVIRNYDDNQPHGRGECCALKLAKERLRNSCSK